MNKHSFFYDNFPVRHIFSCDTAENGSSRQKTFFYQNKAQIRCLIGEHERFGYIAVSLPRHGSFT